MGMVSFIFDTIADVFIVIAGFIAIIQLLQKRKDDKAEINRQIKERTIMYIETVLPSLSNLDEELSSLGHDGTIEPNDDKLTEEINNKIRSFLRSMERLSVGINTDVYDIDIVDRVIGTGIIKTYSRYKEIINKKRNDQNNDRLYIEYENVAERLILMHKSNEENHS